MNHTATLLRDLRRLGIRLEYHGDKLRVDAPADIWTEELRDKIAQHKAALLELLREEEIHSTFRVLVDGYVVVEARTVDEAVRAFDDTVRGVETAETTVAVELRDGVGTLLRVAYFPPWEK